MFPLPALGHANNKQTHNYGKPIFTLLQMRIINSKEINAISRLSGYKKLRYWYTYLHWKIIEKAGVGKSPNQSFLFI